MRPLRIKRGRDGAHYHIMTRTAQKQFLFKDDTIKEWIYKKILRLASIYYVTLRAVTVLDNHYHIVLTIGKPVANLEDLKARWIRAESQKKQPRPWREWLAPRWHMRLSDLSEFAKDLNQSTASHVNHVLQKSGHLWGGRFKSVLVDNNRGLLAAMAYVEMNPVRAGLCRSPKDYRWCSVGRYEQGGPRNAGVTIPPLPGFGQLKSGWKYQKAFSLFMDHLAQLYAGKESHFPCEIAELETVVGRMDPTAVLDLVKTRTKWLTQSVILGGESFCKGVIQRFDLQLGSCAIKPFALPAGLFNSRQRAGPDFESANP